MPAYLSVATVIEKNRIASPNAFIVLVEIDVIDPSNGALVETLYVARNPEQIVFNGNTYEAANFELGLKQEAGSVPEIQVTVQDQTRMLQSRMQQYGGGVGFQIRMIILNTGNMNQPPEIEEQFLVTKATARSYVVTFTLGAENPLSMMFPRRRESSDHCSFLYMDVECGYTGSLPSCDLSLNGANGCSVHNNIANYGGFPGITPQR